MCTFSCVWAIILCCTACKMVFKLQRKHHCSQRGQPSHAAIEGEGRIVLHHEPNQKQLDDSTEGLKETLVHNL